MVKHKRNNINGQPVCWDTPLGTVFASVENIDEVDCVNCLRRLAKDAVLYGNARRPSRKW